MTTQAIKIHVKYYDDGRVPIVTVDPPDAPHEVVFECKEGDLFFAHGGVNIYFTEWQNNCDSEYWYSIESGHDSDGDPEVIFDVRDVPLLPGVPRDECEDMDGRKRVITFAIDQGWITQDKIEFPSEVGE